MPSRSSVAIRVEVGDEQIDRLADLVLVQAAIKGIEEVWQDMEFWTEIEQDLEMAGGAISRSLVVEGARAAESVGVIVDFDTIHREALHIARTTSNPFWHKMTETMRGDVQTAMITWQQSGLGKRGLPDLINALKPTFGKQRAKRIAVTESTRMFAEGNRLAAEMDSAIAGLQWQTAEDEKVCPICGAHNPTTGLGYENLIYPKDSAPACPAHVGCRCALIPVTWGTIRKRPDLWRGGPIPEATTPSPRQPSLEYETVTGPPQPPFEVGQLQRFDMRAEGAHAKSFYRAPDNSRWMFKPELTAGEAELAGYRVAHYAGVNAPETYMIEIGGQRGSIQKLFDDVTPIRLEGIKSLEAAQLQQIQKNQVVDWVISQHDTNSGALLMSGDGSVVAVDKGQAFKFLGKDKLSMSYNPNPNPLAYNQMWDDYVSGAINLERGAIDDVILNLEKMDEGLFIDILKPYADHAADRGLIQSQTTFLDTLVKRKRGLRQAFAELYDAADAARAARAARFAPTPSISPTGAFTVIDDAFAQSIADNGWAGRSAMFAGTELENGNLLLYELQAQRGRMLVMEGKLRAEAEEALLKTINMPATPTGSASWRAASTVSGQAQAAADPFFNDFLAIIKHVNHHLQPGSPGFDGKLNPVKFTNLQAIMSNVRLSKELSLKKHYAKQFSILLGEAPAAETATAIDNFLAKYMTYSADDMAALIKKNVPEGTGKVAAWKPPPPKKPRVRRVSAVSTPDEPLKAVKVTPYRLDRTFENGHIRTTGLQTPQRGATAYEIELSPNIKAVYTPHGDSNPYAKMGRLEIYVEGYTGTTAEINQAIGQLNRLGIKSGLATAEDLELLYLQKVAHAAKIDDLSEWKQISVLNEDRGSRISAMKEFWQRRLGVSKLEDLELWNPMPQFEKVYVPARGAQRQEGGWAFWERFDIDMKEFKKKVGQKSLHHSFGSETPDVFMTNLLERNGQLTATEERIRTGLFRSGQGMSSTADMDSGGASYIFTRIGTRTSQKGRIKFNNRLLLRTDNISYAGDMYGKSDPASKAMRYADPDGWVAASKGNSNETIVKAGINVFDYVDQVMLHSLQQKEKLIELYHSRGIYEMGGKPLDQVFALPHEWKSKLGIIDQFQELFAVKVNLDAGALAFVRGLVEAGASASIDFDDGFNLMPWPLDWILIEDGMLHLQFPGLETPHIHKIDKVELNEDDGAAVFHCDGGIIKVNIEYLWEDAGKVIIRRWARSRIARQAPRPEGAFINGEVRRHAGIPL